MADQGSAPTLGLVINGELRGGRIEEGRPRSTGEGSWPDRYLVSVLAGDDTFRVEFRDEASAKSAVGPDAGVGDAVSIPVSVRAAKGYVFYVARGAGPEEGSYSW